MRRLHLEPRGSPGRLVGLEHELRVLAGDHQVDFRPLIHGLNLGQRNLDPADPNAYRLASGAALTCDGREAEIALPPMAVRPGFAGEVQRRARSERLSLAARLRPSLRLLGVSTHLSVSVPDALTHQVCQLYSTTFAPALMLLMDRRDSPGLLVRPRPGRVELGGEYVEGEHLVAAAAFAVGSVLACERVVRGEKGLLPPALEVTLEPARLRYGWYVDRRAFGGDLYETGRSTPLTSRDGAQMTAQKMLELGWRVVRSTLDRLLTRDEHQVVESFIAADRQLPCETPSPSDADDLGPLVSPGEDPYGSATLLRLRPAAEIAPVMLTWDLAVFVLLDRSRGRTAFAAVPGHELSAFLEDLDAGRLDTQIRRFLGRRRWSRSRLDDRATVRTATLFDQLGPRLALVPAEFGPDGRPVAPLQLFTSRAA